MMKRKNKGKEREGGRQAGIEAPSIRQRHSMIHGLTPVISVGLLQLYTHTHRNTHSDTFELKKLKQT